MRGDRDAESAGFLRGAVVRPAGLTVGFLLAVAATVVVFVTDDPRVLRVAVVGAAWAFVLAAIFGTRRPPAPVDLRREIAQLTEVRADAGRSRAEPAGQQSGEPLVERMPVRTQALRTGPSTAGTPGSVNRLPVERPVPQRERPPVPGRAWPAVPPDPLSGTTGQGSS